nr:peptidoglycan binding domain-containing protein [Syntrophomonas palmitatica]
MGVNYDYSASLERAEEAVTANEGLSGLLHHATIRGAKQNINPVFNFDKSSLTDQLNSIKLQYDKPALDARVMYANDYLEYISHRDGYSININKSLAKIMDSLCQGSLDPIELEIEPVYPRVRLDDIKEVKDVLGISLMKLPGTAEQYKALQTSINGVIFMPDESFTLASFLQDGWASNQQLCQLVDKTITEACTEAGLKVEGTPGYYTNTLEDPILLAASLDKNSLIIKIYGCQTEEGKEIKYIKEKEKIEPGVQFKTDRHISPNQRVIKREGTPGLVDRQYRVVKLHGKVIEKTLLSEQTTPAVDTIILVGPGTIKK